MSCMKMMDSIAFMPFVTYGMYEIQIIPTIAINCKKMFILLICNDVIQIFLFLKNVMMSYYTTFLYYNLANTFDFTLHLCFLYVPK